MAANVSKELFARRNASTDVEHGSDLLPLFDADGLIPAIVTDATSGAVLMFAWMNPEALALTLKTGYGHFYSRSRGRLWQKGEESGNRLLVREARTDCDQDVIWLRVDVEGKGVACHTGEKSCFYRRIVPGPEGTATLELASDVDGHVQSEPDSRDKHGH
jgi:phosphoribosyl-AMP cyclohydrolase